MTHNTAPWVHPASTATKSETQNPTANGKTQSLDNSMLILHRQFCVSSAFTPALPVPHLIAQLRFPVYQVPDYIIVQLRSSDLDFADFQTEPVNVQSLFEARKMSNREVKDNETSAQVHLGHLADEAVFRSDDNPFARQGSK